MKAKYYLNWFNAISGCVNITFWKRKIHLSAGSNGRYNAERIRIPIVDPHSEGGSGYQKMRIHTGKRAVKKKIKTCV